MSDGPLSARVLAGMQWYIACIVMCVEWMEYILWCVSVYSDMWVECVMCECIQWYVSGVCDMSACSVPYLWAYPDKSAKLDVWSINVEKLFNKYNEKKAFYSGRYNSNNNEIM